MKIVIIGAQREGKTELLKVLRRRVFEDYGATVQIGDGVRPDAAGADYIQGGFPHINIFVTNDVEEAARFLKED